MTVTTAQQTQDHETEAAKWNSAIINCIPMAILEYMGQGTVQQMVEMHQKV